MSFERDIEEMQAKGIPVTRENVIAYLMDGESEKWGPEHEAELPLHLQDLDALQREALEREAAASNE